MNFIYAEDEQDKQISFIPTIVYAPPGSLVANGAAHQVDYSIYSNTVAPVNSKAACPSSIVTSVYPDFLKDANTAHIKPESPLKFSSKIAAPASVLSQSPPVLQSYIPENSQMASQMPLAISSSSANNADYRTMDNISIPKTEYCFTEIPVSSNIPVTVSSASNSSESALRHQCLSDQSLRSSIPTVSPAPIEQQSLQAQSANGLSLPSTPSAPRTSTISEALFVRIIVSRCKRIAPLWFRGISSMRERNREESRRTSNNAGHTQSDWSTIAEKIREMNQVMETDTVVNLLKKLHKELPAESVLKFIKCWIGDAEALNDRESCVLSRPDAKGRMRRIDGGKGSDKVWRLDTIVGMLYHGLPMSSTDTNIMVHTCKQELCVRPQHIRFRASSVALVIVLKALAQSGYTVIPPQAAIGPCGTAVQAPDESVDVFGPFSIEELQQYRSENLTPAGESVNRVSLSGADRELAESLPLLKDALSAKTSSSSTATSSTSASPASDNHRLHQQSAPLHGTSRLTSTDLPDSAASLDLKPATYALGEAGLFGGVGDGGGSGKSRFLPAVASSAAAAAKRRSLKRPPPSDETSAAVGPALANHHHLHHQQQPPSTHPPLHHHRHVSSPSPESPAVCTGSLDTESLSMSRRTSTAVSATTSLPEANVFLPLAQQQQQQQQQQQRNPPPCLSTSCRNSQLVAETNLQLDPSQQLPAHFTSQPVGGIHHVQPLYPPQAIGPPPPPPPPSDCSSLVGGGGGVASGKSTPRQPAKKRLEARTPTIDGVLDDLGITTDIGLADMKTGTGNGSGGFQLHTDTPFTPILCRAATCQSSAVASASTAFSSAPPSGRLNSTTEADDASCDEEMKTIFSARRHRSMVHPPNILETFSIQDMKHIQSKFLQQGYSMDQTTNGGFMRSTPCQVKRCASACALPNLSDGSPSDDAPPGLRVPGPASSNERPITGFASPPSLTPPCLTDSGGDCAGGGGSSSVGASGVWQPANFVSPSSAASASHRAPFGNSKPPAHTGDGGGGDPEANRSGLLTTPRQDFVSRIRDSPVFGGHPEIIEMLLSMRQEYGAKANRAGSSCSRPTSRPPQYFMCNFLNGCDSPSPAGLPRNIFNTTPTLCFDGSNAESLEHMRGLSFTPFSIDSDVTGPTLCSAGTAGGEGVPSSTPSSSSVGAGAAPPAASTGCMQQASPPPQLSGPHANPAAANAPSFAR